MFPDRRDVLAEIDSSLQYGSTICSYLRLQILRVVSYPGYIPWNGMGWDYSQEVRNVQCILHVAW